MTVLGLINLISYVATKIKEISHYSKLCRNPFKGPLTSLKYFLNESSYTYNINYCDYKSSKNYNLTKNINLQYI